MHMSGNRNEVKLCQGCRLFDEEFSLERNKDVWQGAAVPKKQGDLTLEGVARPAKRLV